MKNYVWISVLLHQHKLQQHFLFYKLLEGMLLTVVGSKQHRSQVHFAASVAPEAGASERLNMILSLSNLPQVQGLGLVLCFFSED